MLCAVSLIVMLVSSGSAPEPDEDGLEPVPAEPTLDQAKLMVARDLTSRGEEAFRSGDYPEAIRAWTQVMSLMPDKQADFRVLFAHAHHRAYLSDNELEHLHVAHELFTEQLVSLEADDASRGELEDLLAEIEAEFAARAQAEAEAQARRDEAIRREQDRINREAQAKVEAKRQRKQQKVYFGVGGAATGVGLGFLAGMTASLVLGAELEREGHGMANTVGVPDGYYAEHLAQGRTYNRIALTTGLAGGVFTAAGVSLLCVALLRQRSLGAGPESARLVPTLDGFQLRF